MTFGKHLRAALALATCSLVTACSASSSSTTTSTDEAALCAAHATGPEVTKGQRDVSFSREVIPIFQQSCSFSSCHGSNGLNSIFLGAKGRPVNASEIRTSLLEQKPKGLPSMAYVAPSDGAKSYLLRKLDGDLCDLDCTNGSNGCGERMPKGGDPLDAKSIATIETWIANGAPDN